MKLVKTLLSAFIIINTAGALYAGTAEAIGRLNSSNKQSRLSAVNELIRTKGMADREKADRALADRLRKEKDTGIMSHIIKVLSKSGNNEAGDAILSTLNKEKNGKQRVQMINALGNIKHEASRDPLKELLNSKNEMEVLYSASALARIGDDAGLEILGETAINKEKRRGNRSMAIRALSDINSDYSVNILGGLLEDEDFAIRLQAVKALKKIGGSVAGVYIDRAKNDPDERVSKLAASSTKKE